VVDVGGGYYKFVAKHSGQVLDVFDNLTENGTILHQFRDTGSNAQQFRLVTQADFQCVCGNCAECGVVLPCECGDCYECGFAPCKCGDCIECGVIPPCECGACEECNFVIPCECGFCYECGFIFVPDPADNLHISTINVTQSGSWLELHNPTDTHVSTKDLYLSNDESDLFMWLMPVVIVRAGQTVRVRASGNDTCVALKRMTANFDFAVGDTLYLSDVHGVVLSDIVVE
jgi:hypothetical protein